MFGQTSASDTPPLATRTLINVLEIALSCLALVVQLACEEHCLALGTSILYKHTDVPMFAVAVEEAVIALVRLHQRYTFKLSEKLLTGPLEVKQGLTMSPKGGIPVTVMRRPDSKATVTAAAAGA